MAPARQAIPGNLSMPSSTGPCAAAERTRQVNGREHHQDVELFTEHYRGAHAASHTQTGFRIYVVGSRGGGGRSGPHPRGIEEFL